MKIQFLITAFIFLVTSGFSQNNEGDLLRIRDWFREINANMDRYRKVEFPDIKVYKDLNPDHYSMEGAAIYRLGKIDMTRFFKGDQLVKVVLKFYGDREDLTSEYYIRKGRLFFVDKVKIIYDRPKWNNGFKESERSVLKNRFYFKDNHLIKCLAEEKTALRSIGKEDPSYKDFESKILHDFKLYTETYSGKD